MILFSLCSFYVKIYFICFKRDSDGTQKNETEIIAWTLGYYLKHYNDKNNDFILNDVPILMPMTKAIVRTMDIIQYFTALHNIKVPKQFVLAGISKRAWSTWLASAVDNKRVVGLISIVYDMLNISAVSLIVYIRDLLTITVIF